MTFSDQLLAFAFWWRKDKGHRDTHRTETAHSWMLQQGRKGLTRTLGIYVAANFTLCKPYRDEKHDTKP